MTRDEFVKTLQHKIEDDRNFFEENILSEKYEKKSEKELIFDAYNSAVKTATVALVDTFIEAGLLKFDE